MKLAVSKIGLNTSKISFGKGGWSSSKDCSSSYSSYSSDKGCSSGKDCSSSISGLSWRTSQENSSINEAKKTEPANETEKTVNYDSAKKQLRADLLNRLSKYADDAVLVRIITQQLKNLE